jgi:hypothetical protein
MSKLQGTASAVPTRSQKAAALAAVPDRQGLKPSQSDSPSARLKPCPDTRRPRKPRGSQDFELNLQCPAKDMGKAQLRREGTAKPGVKGVFFVQDQRIPHPPLRGPPSPARGEGCCRLTFRGQTYRNSPITEVGTLSGYRNFLFEVPTMPDYPRRVDRSIVSRCYECPGIGLCHSAANHQMN